MVSCVTPEPQRACATRGENHHHRHPSLGEGAGLPDVQWLVKCLLHAALNLLTDSPLARPRRGETEQRLWGCLPLQESYSADVLRTDVGSLCPRWRHETERRGYERFSAREPPEQQDAEGVFLSAVSRQSGRFPVLRAGHACHRLIYIKRRQLRFCTSGLYTYRWLVHSLTQQVAIILLPTNIEWYKLTNYKVGHQSSIKYAPFLVPLLISDWYWYWLLVKAEISVSYGMWKYSIRTVLDPTLQVRKSCSWLMGAISETIRFCLRGRQVFYLLVAVKLESHMLLQKLFFLFFFR